MFEVMERPVVGVAAVDGLRPVIEALGSVAVVELPDAAVEETFAELQRVAEVVELERLRYLREVERRQLHTRDGHLSVASWLAARFRLSHGQARRDAGMAGALEGMPGTRQAVVSGRVSIQQAQVLAAAHREAPEAFERSEPVLVAAAARHSVADLAKVTSFWRDRVVAERGQDPHEVRFAARALHVSRTFAGMVQLDAALDPETGEPVLAAVAAVVDAGARSDREDTRTPAQRRADALGEICRQWLDRSDRPIVAGERPHVVVTVDVGALKDPGTGGASFDRTGAVSAEVARRLACDASVMRVVLAGASQPLDVGRRTPVIPPALRRAVIVRDGSCRFPRCDRPPSWCDVHHVKHWADGGTTSLDNLVLLCRHHHRAIHRREGFTVAMQGGQPVFRRPDGSVLAEDRAPP